MRQVANQRAVFARIAIIFMMVCGAGAGYLLGCGVALVQASLWVDHYAKLMAAKENASLAEARKALNTLQDSRYPPCSEAEIGSFRELVFGSEFLKDAGRLVGGKIDCSATAGRSAHSFEGLTPKSLLHDGTVTYSIQSTLSQNRLKREALRLGGVYVVIGTIPPPNMEAVPIHLTPNMDSGDAQQWTSAVSKAHGGRNARFSADGTGLMGNMLYATRCTASQVTCNTAFTSVPEAIRGQVMLLSASTVAGALAGIFIGMLFSFLYNRKRDRGEQLRRAVEREELQVVYQPVVNLEKRQIVGAEALARWTDEDGNEVAPDEFVKIAEERGFIGGITKTVLRRILSDFAATLQSRPDFRISMNVAAADLSDPEFLPLLEESLQRANVNPSSLIIEITERSAADSAEAMETIRNLRRIGHSIHIDDFGTGYSNLDKLLYLFADTIKIDKAFTGVIGTDSVGAAILPQILKMAKSLNLEVVVEGVETVRQADYFSLGEQKVYVQGWLYGRPMIAEQFIGVLANEGMLDTPGSEESFTTRPGALRIVSPQAA